MTMKEGEVEKQTGRGDPAGHVDVPQNLRGNDPFLCQLLIDARLSKRHRQDVAECGEGDEDAGLRWAVLHGQGVGCVCRGRHRENYLRTLLAVLPKTLPKK